MSKMEEKKLYECKCCVYKTTIKSNYERHFEKKHTGVECILPEFPIVVKELYEALEENKCLKELYKALEEENRCLKAEIESSKRYYKLKLLEKRK